MSGFYNSLPLTQYLIVVFGSGLIILTVAFISFVKKKNVLVTLGLILLAFTGFSISIVKIYTVYNLSWHLKVIRMTPLIGLIAAPILLIGLFQASKYQPELRTSVVKAITALSIFAFVILTVVSYKIIRRIVKLTGHDTSIKRQSIHYILYTAARRRNPPGGRRRLFIKALST
ncbi:hypothetical protein I8J29_31575 [Paenibacillus sp. MWE-103]|uniref:Uncharacterized protein n=1 Tax=Paenibacillus artemisiicola TaxID=1172618 RepID=A0ABS3WK75_9BACL|nr:hypothetical protein [Paenibacillus artemisiicola]MBO7748719.1 hypothetical protein [Paenibacillus artemisiicola]